MVVDQIELFALSLCSSRAFFRIYHRSVCAGVAAVCCVDTSTRRPCRIPHTAASRRPRRRCRRQSDGCEGTTDWTTETGNSRWLTSYKRSICRYPTTNHGRSRNQVSDQERHSLPARHTCRLTDDTAPCDYLPAKPQNYIKHKGIRSWLCVDVAYNTDYQRL